jgi:polyisoprenyl-phosphate glycosyltransferase
MSLPKKPELSIVLPVFNEERNLPLLVTKCAAVAKKNSVEFIFVEDSGSTDATRTVITQLSLRYPFIKAVLTKNRGYGASIYDGLRQASGDYIGWAHADLQTDPSDVVKALSLLKQQENPQKSYVKGNRYGRSMFDQFFTTGMSLFESVLLGTRLWDINAQPNVVHHSFLKLMKHPPSDFSFDLYSYYLARKHTYRIIRFPVYFGKRIHGQSAWNFGFASKLKFIKRTIAFSFRMKRGLR